MKKILKSKLLTAAGIAALLAYFFLLPSGNSSKDTPPAASPIEDMEGIRDFDRLNKESFNIAKGILSNEEAKTILSQGVVSSFVIKNVTDFNPKSEGVLTYIEKNNNAIKQLLKDIETSKEPESIRQQIDIRIQITLMINENLKKIFLITTNYNKELNKLNKQLLEFDFKLKEKISIWTFVAKQNGLEENMEKIIGELLDAESSIDSKLRFLFDGWLNKNTKNKLEIYFSIHEDFDRTLEDFEKVDSLIREKYKKDYSYGQRYLDNMKK